MQFFHFFTYKRRFFCSFRVDSFRRWNCCRFCNSVQLTRLIQQNYHFVVSYTTYLHAMLYVFSFIGSLSVTCGQFKPQRNYSSRHPSTPERKQSRGGVNRGRTVTSQNFFTFYKGRRFAKFFIFPTEF